MSENMSRPAQPVNPRAQSGGPGGRHAGIFIQGPLIVRLVLVMISSLSVYPLAILTTRVIGDDLYSFPITGGVFGVLVLVPFLAAPRARLLRAVALVVGPMFIYWGVARLSGIYFRSVLPLAAVWAIPGVAGALLCAVLTAIVAPLQARLRAVVLASLGGLVGGMAFGAAAVLIRSDDSGFFGFAAWAAYIVWQLLVFLGLYFGASVPPVDTAAQS